MKRLPIALLMGLALMSPGVFADETDEYDWLLRDDLWFMSPDDINIDWTRHPLAEFRKFNLPEGTPLYRGSSVFGLYAYYYPVGTDNMVRIGWDKDKDGEDDILDISTRDNYSYFFLAQDTATGRTLLGAGGRRKGEMRNADHPFVGEWLGSDGDLWYEVRLVEPDDYRYFVNLDPEIRGFHGFRYTDGRYLLKYLGNGIFESEGSFSEGRIRLEVKKAGYILLTPISDKSAEEEPRKPMRMYAETSKIPLRFFERYGSEEPPKAAAPSAAPVLAEPAVVSAPVAIEPGVRNEPPAKPMEETDRLQPTADNAEISGLPRIIGAVAGGIAVVVVVAVAVILLRKRRKAA